MTRWTRESDWPLPKTWGSVTLSAADYARAFDCVQRLSAHKEVSRIVVLTEEAWQATAANREKVATHG